MAKISARGDSEIARWKNSGGSVYVLTTSGRLLKKSGVKGDEFKLWMCGFQTDSESVAKFSAVIGQESGFVRV